MLESVDATISGLRNAVGAQNDSDLANKLGIDKSTISGWRARGRVPEKFVNLLRSAPDRLLEVWPELHERAIAIALARFVILRQSMVQAKDLDEALAGFLDTLPWWLIMHRAALEVRSKMDALAVDLKAAAALILQEDLRDPKATRQRVAAQLAEDLADNPSLKHLGHFQPA